MKRSAIFLPCVCLALLVVVPRPSQAQMGGAAALNGQNQNPPLNSAATGEWNGTLVGDTIAWNLRVSNCQQAIMAHIHQGGPKDNGPVIVFLVPVGVGDAATSNNLPQLSPPESGDLLWVGNFTAADQGGPAKGMSIQDLINLFKSNQAYVNVHTVQNPNGEVRGQVTWM